MKHSLPQTRPQISPPETISTRAVGRVHSGAGREARSVKLVWRDPVTGDRLSIAMMLAPEMIRCLESEGFQLEAQITRSAG